ncbi:MAG: MBL fold metallo-hydrolase [Opitutaceae bacterium]|jgi:phosphoribosyl 1,2-cyclic phosphodiesterase|nr:MBL fold metallo-hydrolase [Opitutaceae bacterium]
MEPVKLHILGSGSSGNCALLRAAGTRVLIDAGITRRKLEALLAASGESVDAIDAIFITHEHADHIYGLGGFKKSPRVKVFANASTAAGAQKSLKHRPLWQLFETGDRFRFRDIAVETFSVPHDAADPVGYTFSVGRPGGAEFRLAWLPDMGHAPAHIHERIRDVDVLAVESNHCPQLLRDNPNRPWSLKQRISGRHGHLSNEGVCELLGAVASPRWRHVFLTHLSGECNTPEAVSLAIEPLRGRLSCRFTIATAAGAESCEF